MAGLQPNHASHQTMIVRNCSPAHQRRNDRHASHFSKLNQKVRGIGVDDATAGDDKGALSLRQHIQGLFYLRAGGARLVHR